jgi:pimeloyl-ACP methyl ester carboxylesterase
VAESLKPGSGSDIFVSHHPDPFPPERGDQPFVVLVHGAPDRSRSFRQVLALLDDLDIVTYDRRGYGNSVEAVPATSLGDHVADLVRILEAECAGGRPATVVGHSFGCNVVVATAIARPDLVVSIGVWELPIPWVEWWPTPDFRDNLTTIVESEDPEGLGENSARNALSAEAWDRVSEERRQLLRFEGRAFQADVRSITEPAYDIDQLLTPLVLACGSTTTTGHREAAHILAARFGAPLMDVEGAGHFGPANHPEAFAELVRRSVALGRRPGAVPSN